MPDQRSQSRRGHADLSDMTRSSPQAPEVLAGRENQRIKQMIKASLFAEANAPVKIGRYTVVRPIGAGGMGVVYAAYDEELDRRIAVKLLRSGSSEHDRARLLREAQAMAKLSHPNVVTVHEVGTFEDQVYVAMEFVRGKNLRDWLSEGPHPWRTIVDRFVLAGRGLAAAHDVGLVHRDFKPANVLVGDDGRIMVSDFGLVRATGGPPSAEELAHASLVTQTTTALDTSLTMTGTIMGTPAYMSPEQHLGRTTDARSDQFSLCVALYEALYARHPFPGETLHDLAAAVTEGALREPPRDGKVPAWVGRVIVRGLADDPEARWPTIHALLDELDRDPERAWRLRRNAALITSAVVAVIAGLVWLVQERSEAATVAAAAEAAAQERRDAAEQARDRAFEDLQAQLEQTRAALDEAETQRTRAEAEARRAEEQSRLAEAQRREAEAQRREAEEQRGEAEHQRQEAERQTDRAVQEARRARDATRLAQSLGAAADDPTSVLALLRETEAPAETPGWVPAAVDTLLSPVSGAILRAHRGTVRDAAVSPDGETIATAADDGEVLRWRWRSGEVERLGRHQGPVVAVAFTPDGDGLLTAGADGRAMIWRSGQDPVELAHPRPLSAAAFSPDGRWIATAAQDDVVRLWPAAGGKARELGRHRGPIHDLAFSPDGSRVATASADSTARVWELRGGGRGAVLDRHGGAVRALAFDAKGERLATAAQDGVVRIWRPGAPGEAPRELRGHEGEVVAVAFTPTGEHVLSASLDRTARLWPTDGGAPAVLRGHRGRIYAASISADGRSILTASQDGSARLWDRRDLDAPPRELKGHTEELSSARFSADGALAVTTSRDNTVRVWPLRRDATAAALLRHGAEVGCVAYDPSGAHLLTCAGEREVWWWRPGDGAPTRKLRHSAAVVDARFADDGAAIVAVTSDGAIRRWPREGAAKTLVSAGARDLRRAAYHPPSGRLLSAAMVEQAWLREATGGADERVLRGHTGTLHALAFSPDGRLVATGSSDRSARLWGVDGRLRAQLSPHSGRVTAIAFRGDNLEVATASWDKRIRVWGVDGRLKATLVGHEGPVWSVAYSPDGRHLVSAADDRSVRVWPADGRGEAIILRGHHGPVVAATYRPDGRAIASASADGSARIWDADFDPRSLRERLWRASPVCLPPRERVRLLAEDEATATAAHDACVAEARARTRDGAPHPPRAR